MEKKVENPNSTEKEDLKRFLKAKLNASRISRLSNNAKQLELDKLQKNVEKQFGKDLDMTKVVEYMNTKLQKKNK